VAEVGYQQAEPQATRRAGGVGPPAESLWQLTLRRLQIAEQEAHRNIPLWGKEEDEHTPAVSREQIEEKLHNRNGAYQRLRRVMDAWAALWFWPLTDTDGTTPPTVDQWIEACQALLGRDPEARRRNGGMTNLATALGWDDLNATEELNLNFAGVVDIDQVIKGHSWLGVCEEVARQQGFFHWELDFAAVFAQGGFDLQLGNPPWVRPQTDMDALLAEGDPWWQLAIKPSETARNAKRAKTLTLPAVRDLVMSATADTAATDEYLGSMQAYPLLGGLQPDLYRCFIQQTWKHSSASGIVTLIHPETHFTDQKARLLREHTYSRLRRHWQFTNELILYEINDRQWYGVHVYGRPVDHISFMMASSLYHPETVERSLKHDGTGDEPGLKDPAGNWDLRPHYKRIINVTDMTLRTWHATMEDETVSVRQTRMVFTVNTAAFDVLAILARQPRARSLPIEFSPGWHETADRRKGFFELRWGAPAQWADVILQGPHLFVSTPMYKEPNPTMKHKADWSAIDLEALSEDAIPVTAYKPLGDPSRYDAAYTKWASGPARAYYRVAWRCLGQAANERTLIPALIPPGAAHPDPVSSAGLPGDNESLCVLSGFLSSLLIDFDVRVAPGHIRLPTINRLPIRLAHHLQASLTMRILRLNCMVNAYAHLWRDVYKDAFRTDRWTGGRPRVNRPELGAVAMKWTASTPLRIAEDRRQALVELDALVALMLGVTADQLCIIYRTQFPVLYGYDHKDYAYDVNGRLVPNSVLSVWRKKGDQINGAERTATNQAGHTYIYELPFRLLDREADMRAAYAEFERRLAAHE
jgi:hypothetical protein